MTGDPKVLAGLQQAFEASDDPRIHRLIGNAWEFETASCSTIHPTLGDRIRAWTPPEEPSLADRVAELTERVDRHLHQYAAMDFTVNALHQAVAGLSSRINTPEPPAPDDPVCVACGHNDDSHFIDGCVINMSDGPTPCGCLNFLPAPAEPTTIDPVRVEAAVRAAHDANDWLPAWDHRSENARTNLRKFTATAIRAYLNGGAS